MICNKCGKDIPEDSKFCVYCGSKDIKKGYSKDQKRSVYKATSDIKSISIALIIISVIAIAGVVAVLMNSNLILNDTTIPMYENNNTLKDNGDIKDNTKLSLSKFVLNININKDRSMDITEIWNCNNLQVTKTLYKTFVIDNNKYKGISNVKVSQVLENDRVIEFEQDDEWKYHLSKETFFAGINNEGNYEIAWGIAENSDKGTYVISYTVNDVVAVYNDCAELYWQFIGNGFALPVDIVIGTIKLPTDLISKEDIKVWGHTTKSLNGEIHVTSLNSVEFQVNKYKPYNYVEVRLAMPTYLFDDDESKINTNKLESIVEEEKNWARAN